MYNICNIYGIRKTMWPPSYRHNRFVAIPLNQGLLNKPSGDNWEDTFFS